MAAFDHMDGVDLHIAQMLHRGARCLGPVAKGRVCVEPLGMQPDASGVGLGEGEGLEGHPHPLPQAGEGEDVRQR